MNSTKSFANAYALASTQRLPGLCWRQERTSVKMTSAALTLSKTVIPRVYSVLEGICR
jgi:hypothetical protein